MQYAFEKLGIWKIGMEIVEETYRITTKFPKEEVFGLKSQMRRAASSIPLNIAEGSSRRGKKDFSIFLRRALGSDIELLTALRISIRLGYISLKESERLESLCQEEYYKTIAFEKVVLK